MLSICRGRTCGRPVPEPFTHCSPSCFTGRDWVEWRHGTRRHYVFDLKKLGRAPGLDWQKPLAAYSKVEIERLGEAFLSCVSPKTQEEMDAIKATYETQLDEVPF